MAYVLNVRMTAREGEEDAVARALAEIVPRR